MVFQDRLLDKRTQSTSSLQQLSIHSCTRCQPLDQSLHSIPIVPMGSERSIANRVMSSKYPEVLRFRLNPLDSHPLFGTATELEGEIPFLGPTARLHGYLNYLEANPAIIRSISLSILSKYRDGWPDKNDDEILEEVQKKLPSVLLMAGEFEETETAGRRRSAFAELSVLVYVVDSILDRAAGLNETKSLDLVEMDYVSQLGIWMNAARPPFSSLPSGTVNIERVKRILQSAMDEFGQAFGEEADKFFLEVRDDTVSMIQAHILSMVVGSGGGSDGRLTAPFSLATMTEIWHHQCGVRGGATSLAACKNLWLSPQIKKDELYKIAFRRSVDIVVTMNAILGLTNDAREGNVDSPITWSVVHGGVGLQDAFQAAMKQLHGQYSDYSLASEKLIELYATREPLIKDVVEMWNWGLDAMLLTHKLLERYGINDKSTVVKNV